MPLASADVRASVHACKGEQKVLSAIVLPLYHSPVAIRKSPSFRLGRSLALPFFAFVPRPTLLVP